MTLDQLLAQPGIWLIVNPDTVFFVDVDPDGTCHQVQPETLARDGVLLREHWTGNLQSIAAYGPLQRVRRSLQ